MTNILKHDVIQSGQYLCKARFVRAEIWPLHRRCAELGGQMRAGLEDTFYLPDGVKARSNGQLIDAIVKYVREASR